MKPNLWTVTKGALLLLALAAAFILGEFDYMWREQRAAEAIVAQKWEASYGWQKSGHSFTSNTNRGIQPGYELAHARLVSEEIATITYEGCTDRGAYVVVNLPYGIGGKHLVPFGGSTQLCDPFECKDEGWVDIRLSKDDEGLPKFEVKRFPAPKVAKK
jgi:hypothetical protein